MRNQKFYLKNPQEVLSIIIWQAVIKFKTFETYSVKSFLNNINFFNTQHKFINLNVKKIERKGKGEKIARKNRVKCAKIASCEKNGSQRWGEGGGIYEMHKIYP